jgi:hypothetical protein
VELLAAGGVADRDRRDQRAAALLGQQPRAVSLDELCRLCLELADLSVQAADLGDLLAGDPGSRAGRQLAQRAVDPVKHARLVERPAFDRALELGAQLKQMPAQPVHGAGPLGDQILAVIRQHADLHRPLVQIRDREPLDTVLDDRPGDRERVDLE